jgi:hypothetical protein
MEEMDETEAVPQVHSRHFILSFVAFSFVLFGCRENEGKEIEENEILSRFFSVNFRFKT